MLAALFSPRGAGLLAVIALCGLVGCTKENSDDVAIATAQSCLDEATTTSQADACAAKVANIQSAQASTVRCSANLIAQGFTGSRLAKAYQQMKSSNGSNATASSTMLAYFVFRNDLANDTPSITNTNCAASGDASLTGIGNLIQAASQIAAFAQTGSLTGSIAGTALDPSSGNFNAAQLASAITQAYGSNSTALNTAVGTVAISAATAYCSTGSTLSGQSICTILTAAVASGNNNPTSIGYALLAALQ